MSQTGEPSAREDRTPMVTHLLNAAGAGDPAAAAALMPVVYEHLRRLARARLKNKRPDQTLQATALVHEVYLRLVDQPGTRQWNGRWHFFAAAAEAMRQIMVDNARRRKRPKHGGDVKRVELDDAHLIVDDPPGEMLALDEALNRLAVDHPKHAKVVNLRFFAGLTMLQIAEALGIPLTTAERHWSFARAWLYREMQGEPRNES